MKTKRQQRQTLKEQLCEARHKCWKSGDAAGVAYYDEQIHNPRLSACASWETFKGSWAGQEWRKRHAAAEAAVLEQMASFRHTASYLSVCGTVGEVVRLTRSQEMEIATLRHDGLLAWMER